VRTTCSESRRSPALQRGDRTRDPPDRTSDALPLRHPRRGVADGPGPSFIFAVAAARSHRSPGDPPGTAERRRQVPSPRRVSMPGTPCERFDGWSPSHGTAGGRNSGRDDDDDDGGGGSAVRSQAILFIVDRRPLSVCMPASPSFSLFFRRRKPLTFLRSDRLRPAHKDASPGPISAAVDPNLIERLRFAVCAVTTRLLDVLGATRSLDQRRTSIVLLRRPTQRQKHS